MGDIADSLRGTKAPAIPTVPKQYVSESFSQSNNVLRIYFNQLDAANLALRGAVADLETQIQETQVFNQRYTLVMS